MKPLKIFKAIKPQPNSSSQIISAHGVTVCTAKNEQVINQIAAVQ